MYVYTYIYIHIYIHTYIYALSQLLGSKTKMTRVQIPAIRVPNSDTHLKRSVPFTCIFTDLWVEEQSDLGDDFTCILIDYINN